MAQRDLNIPQRLPGNSFGYPVKAGIRLFGRALIALTSAGFAVPVGHAEAVAFAGIANEGVDNRDGTDGASHVTVYRDVRGFNLFATPSDLNKPVYATDDETLTVEATTGLRVGIITGIDDGRVWVDLSK